MLRTRFRKDSLEKVRSVSKGSLDRLTCDHDDIARLFACESRNSRSAVHPETAHVEHAGVTRALAHPLHPRRVLLAPFRATRFARHSRLTRVALVTLQKISISWSMVIVARTTFRSVGRGRLIRCGDRHACAQQDAGEARTEIWISDAAVFFVKGQFCSN